MKRDERLEILICSLKKEDLRRDTHACTDALWLLEETSPCIAEVCFKGMNLGMLSYQREDRTRADRRELVGPSSSCCVACCTEARLDVKVERIHL